MEQMTQIQSNNGVIYYNNILNALYIKDDNSFIYFDNKKVLHSKKVINQILDIKGIHLRNETCMHTGKTLIKVCLYINQNGGVHTLKSSYNKKEINEFILNYKVA